MPEYHKSDYWVLIVYPQGYDHGTILCTNSTWSSATIFECQLKPEERVNLWVAAVDPESLPDVGQILYPLTIPTILPGDSVTFNVEFDISGESGGHAALTFVLTRVPD